MFCGSSGSKLDIRIPRCPFGAPDFYIISRIIVDKVVINALTSIGQYKMHNHA